MSIFTTAAATMLANAAEKLVELTQKLDALATDRRLKEHILPIREEILRVKELVFEAKQVQLKEMATLQQEHANDNATIQKHNEELIATIHRLQFPDQQSPLEPVKEQILAFLASVGGCHMFHISGHINAGDELLRFHLTELTDRGLIHHACDRWSIAQLGRRYLISRGLLT